MRTVVRRGDDRLFALGATLGPLDVERQELRAALPALSTVANEADVAYRQDAQVIAEMERLRQRYTEELGGLERLYTSVAF